MGTVTVLTADRVIQFENQDLIGGSVDVNGDLILQKRDGTSINLGNVKDHGQLTGLADDDHQQYALADGSRGAFASTAQGAKADAALPKTNATVDVVGNGPNVSTITITDDATSSTNWLSRWIVRWKESSAVGALVRNVFLLNEYGEVRIASAKHNTTGFRIFVKEFPNNPTQARDMTVPVAELMDDRNTRTSLRAWLGDGTLTRKGIKMSECLVLGPTDPVPAGTPVNTVIVRKSA